MAGNRSMEKLMKTGDDDFSFAIPGISRFRMNAYRQRGSLAAVIRVIAFEIPKPEDIHIPKQILDLGDLQKGLVVVTGPAGSGKSTTLACIIDQINSTKTANIITLEDPIEFLHKHKMGVISQREIENDTMSYVNGLRATLRQSPDVILLGEMRDYETISVAMNAAETGHLLFSTLHTVGAASTINRIIDVFPSDQQRQVSVMLSMILQAVVSQQLLPTVDGGMIPAFEIMVNTPAVSNLIRSGKAYQIDSVIASEKELMLSMDACIWGYYKEGIITKEVALQHAINQEMLERRL
jgi:twitching motility protein PilT